MYEYWCNRAVWWLCQMQYWDREDNFDQYVNAYNWYNTCIAYAESAL